MGDVPFRWGVGLLLASAGTLSALYRHRAARASGRIARSQEPAGLILMRAIVALPLLGSILAFVIHPAWLDFARLSLPRPLRWFGAVVGLMTLPLEVSVLRALGRNISETVLTKIDHALVTHGPYAVIRHPLYTTGLLLLLSITLMSDSGVIGALAALAAAGILGVVIPREEAALIQRFGGAYEAYRRGTGRLLPRVGRRS